MSCAWPTRLVSESPNAACVRRTPHQIAFETQQRAILACLGERFFVACLSRRVCSAGSTTPSGLGFRAVYVLVSVSCIAERHRRIRGLLLACCARHGLKTARIGARRDAGPCALTCAAAHERLLAAISSSGFATRGDPALGSGGTSASNLNEVLNQIRKRDRALWEATGCGCSFKPESCSANPKAQLVKQRRASDNSQQLEPTRRSSCDPVAGL